MSEDGSQFRLSIGPHQLKVLNMVEAQKLQILLENSSSSQSYQKFPFYTDHKIGMVGLEDLMRDNAVFS